MPCCLALIFSPARLPDHGRRIAVHISPPKRKKNQLNNYVRRGCLMDQGVGKASRQLEVGAVC